MILGQGMEMTLRVENYGNSDETLWLAVRVPTVCMS